eukprot:6694794-Alexandrium_andersonii.AAC.1
MPRSPGWNAWGDLWPSLCWHATRDQSLFVMREKAPGASPGGLPPLRIPRLVPLARAPSLG